MPIEVVPVKFLSGRYLKYFVDSLAVSEGPTAAKVKETRRNNQLPRSLACAVFFVVVVPKKRCVA